jgi:hypothetical protein
LWGQTHLFHFFSIRLFSGHHRAHIFQNVKLSCILLYAKPWEHPTAVATVSVVVLLSAGINSFTRCTVASVINLKRQPGRTSSVTFEQLWGNFTTQLWFALCDKHFLPQTGNISLWISFASGPFAHKKWCTTVRCSSVVHPSSTVTILTTETGLWRCSCLSFT